MILNPVDFKNYIYCPRQIYYKYIHNFELEPTIKMLKGQNLHILFTRIEKRRNLKRYGIENFEKEFDLKLYSKDEMLSGEIDMILKNNEEIIPVDFKMTETSFLDGYILQLYAYSRLLTSIYNKKSEYGFLVFSNTENVKKIIFNEEVKNEYLEIRDKMLKMISSEYFPEFSSDNNCSECEYINFCRDTE